MDLQHGTWGERYRLWQTPTMLLTFLKLNPHKRCSWHKHEHAYNLFFVTDGSITIKTDIGPDRQRNLTTIRAGGIPFEVKPGVMHEFRTGAEPARVIEIAYVKYDISDIHRRLLGGDMELTGEKNRVGGV